MRVKIEAGCGIRAVSGEIRVEDRTARPRFVPFRGGIQDRTDIVSVTAGYATMLAQ